MTAKATTWSRPPVASDLSHGYSLECDTCGETVAADTADELLQLAHDWTLWGSGDVVGKDIVAMECPSCRPH